MGHFEYSWTSGDGKRLYGQGWVRDDEPKAAICLVHGLGEHSGRYKYVAEKLTGAGYALISFDLRGHGKSEGVRGHAETYDLILDDIAHLIKEAGERFPRKPRFLYGHSLGGNLVINYALRRKPQIAGVIATGPAFAVGEPVPSWKLASAKILYRTMPAMQMANGLDFDNLSRDAVIVESYKNDPLVHDRVSVRLAMDTLEAGLYAVQHAREFHLPLLLMQGSGDHIVSPDMTHKFANQVPGDCTYKVWSGFYHEIHNEPEKDEVIQFMIEWLGKHVSQAAGTPAAHA